MRKITNFLIVFLMLFGAVTTQAKPDLSSPEFDGIWIGEPERIHGPNLSEGSKSNNKRKFRIDISGPKGIVSEWKADHWLRFWGIRNVTFNVSSYETNAVMYQTVSGTDIDCAWVETWTFNLTKVDSNTIKAYYFRTVNNHECEIPLEEDPVWTLAGSVILKKTKE